MSKNGNRPTAHGAITDILTKETCLQGDVMAFARLYAKGTVVPKEGIQHLLDIFRQLEKHNFEQAKSLIHVAVEQLEDQLEEYDKKEKEHFSTNIVSGCPESYFV